jgi:hypothetical protein
MLGLFAANIYIGESDTVLVTLNTLHHDSNWLLALLDLIAAGLLIAYRPKSRLWVFLSGIAYPVAYLLLLFADVETDMCLFTPHLASGQCFSNPYVSFQYLILGNRNEGWLLWPYTIPTAIALLVATLILCSMFVFVEKKIRGKTSSQGPVPGA